MGLVTGDPLVVNSVVITQVIPTYTTETITTTEIHQPTMVCTDGSSSSDYAASKSIDKTIYRIFSMQDDMKTLMYPDRVKSEFDSFIEQASLKTDGLGYNIAFDSLDEYMGTLGVTNEIC